MHYEGKIMKLISTRKESNLNDLAEINPFNHDDGRFFLLSRLIEIIIIKTSISTFLAFLLIAEEETPFLSYPPQTMMLHFPPIKELAMTDQFFLFPITRSHLSKCNAVEGKQIAWKWINDDLISNNYGDLSIKNDFYRSTALINRAQLCDTQNSFRNLSDHLPLLIYCMHFSAIN